MVEWVSLVCAPSPAHVRRMCEGGNWPADVGIPYKGIKAGREGKTSLALGCRNGSKESLMDL